MEDQARHVVDLEQQVGAEGDARAVDVDVALAGGAPAGEVPLLVELAVVGQIGLGHDAAHRPALDDEGAVVQATRHAHGRTDDDRRQETGAGGADGLDGGEGLVQEHVTQHEVVDGVAGQAQLGEGDEAHAVVGQSASPFDDGGGVGVRVRQHDGQGDGSNTRETLIVGGAELDGRLRGGGPRGCVLVHASNPPMGECLGGAPGPAGRRAGPAAPVRDLRRLVVTVP